MAAPLFAEPVDLSDQPIFLGTNAPANVLFLIDDSGSMDWEIVTQDADNDGRFTGTQPDGTNPAGAGSVKHRDADNDGDADCGFSNGDFFGYMYAVEFGSNFYEDNSNDCNTADDNAWRFRNHNFNPLYYNPAQMYTPWAGVDDDGNEFTNIDPTNAPDNPYDPDDFINLTTEGSNWLNPGHAALAGGFRFYIWTDDGDGVFENGEQTQVRMADLPANPETYSDTNGDGSVSFGDTKQITSAGNSITLPYPASRQQFANWFSYYRSRDLVAKNAYGKVIAAARNVRMGLITINLSANEPVREMNQEVDSGNKRALMDELYSFSPNGNTPLRNRMYDCGQYLDCANSNNFIGNSFGCPRLEQADGGQCQQNFLVTMTDGYYNGSFSGLGNRDGDDNTQWDGGAFADTQSNTLGDIAMHYYERDLHPDLPDSLVAIEGVDEATHQHMVSYTVAFGVNGTLVAAPVDSEAAFSWPDPGSSNAGKIDDLRHAAYNGRGLFLDSRDPSTLDSSLQDALSDIGDRTSTAAAVSLNSGSLNIETGLFQARFDSGDWSGELLFLPVSDGSGATQGCSNEAIGQLCPQQFDAGDVLNGQNWNSQRSILTRNSDTGAGVAFRWNAISDTQQGQLRNNPLGSGSFNAESGQLILRYLRGDRQLEDNANLRTRSSVLGDIVNSDPFYVAAPVENYDFDDYAAFRAANSNRTPVVYVGANDGMLHAFNAQSGTELFAYVPTPVLGDLNRLVFSNYNNNHRYFVDGPPVVGDAFLNDQWRSVLVSGLRSGGQAVFALDVTNPTGVNEGQAASTVLWEFTDADDPNLGYTFAQPTITRMANGRWAAIISSGYNNTEADGNASADGRGHIFILYLTGPGEDGVWDEGTDYERITLPAASGSSATPAGVATPAAVSIDDDVAPEHIYVGDLNGNMWRIDVSNADSNLWGVSFSGSPLFVARDGAGARQPITVRAEVGAHPTGLDNGLIVYFGTGRFLEESDNQPANAQTQSLYGIWDENDPDITPAITRANLLQQQILQEIAVSPNTGDEDPDNDNTATACNASDNCFRVTTDNDISYISQAAGGGGHRGWYMDLILADSANNRGERQVSTPILREGRIFFTTLLPSGQVCDFGGDSFLMILDPKNGGRLDFSPFDVDNNNLINDTDIVQTQIDGEDVDVYVTGRKSRVGIVPRPAILTVPGKTQEYLYQCGSRGDCEPIETPSNARLGRILWRQLR